MGAPGKPQYYSISELKSRMLNIAQTSLYHVKFEVPPAVSSFIGASGRGIVSENISNIELLCSEATLPGTSLATHDVTSDYHGVTEKMAYRRIYDDTLDLSFYVDRDYNVIEYFDSWIDYITGLGSTFGRESYKSAYSHYRMNYPSKYKADMYIVKYEKDIGNTLNYTFVKAFPISVTSTPVTYQQSDLLKYDVSFSYIRYVRERSKITPPKDLKDPRAPGVVERNKSNFSRSTTFRPELYGSDGQLFGPNDFLNLGIPGLDQFGFRDQLGRPPSGAPGPTVAT
jgi:hypothetical protein